MWFISDVQHFLIEKLEGEVRIATKGTCEDKEWLPLGGFSFLKARDVPLDTKDIMRSEFIPITTLSEVRYRDMSGGFLSESRRFTQMNSRIQRLTRYCIFSADAPCQEREGDH